MKIQIPIALLLCAILAGCGGGGSGDPNVIPVDPPEPPVINQAPSISSVSPESPVSISSGEQRTVVVAASDPENDPLTFQWQTTAGAIQPLPEDYRATFIAPTTSTPTTCTVRVEVSDNHAHTTSVNIVFNVAGASTPANEPPEISEVTANPVNVALGGLTTLTATATDPEGDPLTYVWYADAGSIQSQNGATATWKAPGTNGVHSVSVSVSDGNNPAVLGRVDVTVGSGGGEPVTNGLTATYIQNDGKLAHPDLSRGNVVGVQIDPNVNFDWNQKSPMPALVTDPATGDADDFGIRWTGYLLGSQAGTYVFRAKYDDGIRVWVTNDQNQRQLVIDGWSTGPFPLLEGSINLEGSKWYPIVVEFFESKANAYVSLSWVPPGGAEQVIPRDKLRTE